MDIQRVALLAITAAVLSLFLRQAREGWGQYVSLAGGIVLVLYVLSQLSGIRELSVQLREMIGSDGDTYFRLIWKALGITYLCEIAADVCRETGNLLIAKQVEICGKIAVLLMGVPILISLYQMLTRAGG